EHGFDNVSTDRLGAAVGIAGPSLYKNFPTKADRLAAALLHSPLLLSPLLPSFLPFPPSPAPPLRQGLDAYRKFARRHHHYLGAMVS
ncbi:TetR family transcriptional regulator, partial [Streptomyces tateyamensis]